MRRIDKKISNISSKKYVDWITELESQQTKHPLSRTYYDDIIMDLYKCQNGVCAYTERYICIKELYDDCNWENGKYLIKIEKDYDRTDHAGELDHFNPQLKNNQYWLWDNLFMIDSTINGRKSNNEVIDYLKPDLEDYSPEKYFDYDETTHRFIPNTEITNEQTREDIQKMIDTVLFLNHGVIKNDRKDFVNSIKYKIQNNFNYTIDRFFTATNWCI